MTATLTASRPIRQLPVELANQIAAGEVVERPASVVKELVENSLDAGASRVEISISQGGLQSIIIRDNGCGIPKQELPLAISRHATSKIINLQELENIQSLGFRGEALASIGSVSRMQLISCARDEGEAWQIDCGRDELNLQPASHPAGTSIMVQDLFYNTPARRKFMRTEKTEFRHIDEVVRRMALSHFDVGFTFRHNDRLVYQFAPAETEAARNRRVAKLCGKAFMDSVRQVEFSAQGLRLWGWVSGPEFSRSQNDLQHFYVNGRIIRDRLITHAIRQVYQAWIHPGRHAAYLLHFEIDPAAVDVNVHPTKHEVRFREARMVHDFVHRSLRDALSGSEGRAGAKLNWQPSAGYEHQTYATPVVAETSLRTYGRLGQARFLLKNRFMISENDRGLVIVDVQRASQKLISQKLAEALREEGGINSRPLLIPKSFVVTQAQLTVLEAADASIRRLGFDISINGPESILLRKIPLVLAGADLQAVLDTLFVQLAMPHTADDLLDIINAIAQAAAKSQTIESSPDTLSRLLNEIESLNDSTLWRSLDEQELLKLLNQK